MKRKEFNSDLVETGERIRVLRESKGMSQEQLAESLGVSKNSIYRYENGQMEMGIECLIFYRNWEVASWQTKKNEK